MCVCVFGVQGLWRFGFVCFRLGYSGCCKPSGLGFGVWSVSVGCFDCSGLVRRGGGVGAAGGTGGVTYQTSALFIDRVLSARLGIDNFAVCKP